MGLRRISAYRRENGRVGVRNHVVILSVDDISNAACEAVASHIKGTMALPHAYGRLQFGEDLELFFRTMIGIGSNPNVAAAVVIGIEPGWTNRIVDGIAKTGKPVADFSIEGKGDIRTIAEAQLQSQGICAVGDGAAKDGVRLPRVVHQREVRRVRYHDRPGELPHCGQRDRQALRG